jgi:hypothetical protein
MSQADQALIVIHRGEPWFGRVHYHRVRIDGRLAGYTERVSPTTEFSVDPGVHTVEVSMGFAHSHPLHLELAPGSKTDVRIAPWPGASWFRRSRGPAFFAMVTVSPLALLEEFGVHRWWHTPLMMVGFFCLWIAYSWIAPLIVKDYWILWILEPMSESVAESGSPAAV